MAGFELEFSGRRGEKETLGERELRFFGEKFLSKPPFFPPIALRIAKNRAFRSIRLLVKSMLSVMAHGTKRSTMSPEEFCGFCSGFIGFEPRRIRCLQNGLLFHTPTPQAFASSFNTILEVMLYDQYDAAGSVGGKIVVDAGANVGAFSLWAAVHGARKVYAFEPVAETYSLLSKNISANRLGGTIVPANLALGAREGRGKISFASGGDASASLAFPDSGKRAQDVRIARLDGLMAGKGRVGFIKIDTEGYEEKILLGASGIIRKAKPVLAFSAYHRPEDKIRLPETVKGLREGYSCRLLSRYEEVLYCG